jgi:3-dehydroquinate dehydratase-2
MKLYIINGPNLNLLGKREKSIYGERSFEDYFKDLQDMYEEVELHYFQSNHEGALIDKIQEIGYDVDGVVINAGGFTHSSVAIRDAIAAVAAPFVEVHISNIHSREEFRHYSFLTDVCEGIIAGLGLDGYRLAIEYLISS